MDPASLLQCTDTELDKIEIKEITQSGDVTICQVESCFMQETYGDEEEMYELFVYWEDELSILAIEMVICTNIPPEGYGWALDELNSRTRDKRWMLQVRLEYPAPDEEPQLLAFVGTWKLPVPESFLGGNAGRQLIGSLLRQMLQTVCMETVLMGGELSDDYAEHPIN